MAEEYKTSTYKSEKSYFEPYYHVSWGGVFAGAIVALTVGLALSLLGLGIGLGTGAGAGIWIVISSLIALFAGGFVSSRVSEYISPMNGVLQGIFMWALATLGVLFLLSTPVGATVSGIVNIAGAPTATIISRTAIWGFVEMVLGLGVASLGGRLGVTKELPHAMVAEKEREIRRAA